MKKAILVPLFLLLVAILTSCSSTVNYKVTPEGPASSQASDPAQCMTVEKYFTNGWGNHDTIRADKYCLEKK